MEFNNPVICPVPVLQWGRTLDSLSMWWCLIMASYLKCIFFICLSCKLVFVSSALQNTTSWKERKRKTELGFFVVELISSLCLLLVSVSLGGRVGRRIVGFSFFFFGKGHTAEVVPAQVKLAAVTLWGKGCVYFPHPQGSTGIQPGLRIRFTCTNRTLGGGGMSQNQNWGVKVHRNAVIFTFLYFFRVVFIIFIRRLPGRSSSCGTWGQLSFADIFV